MQESRQDAPFFSPDRMAYIVLYTMKLQINGEERTFARPVSTLAALVETLGMKPDRLAIELNRDIVPRDRWADTSLNDGDKLEVVHFVGGGSTDLPQPWKSGPSGPRKSQPMNGL